MTPEVMSAVMTEADRIIVSMMGPSGQHITHRPRVRKEQLTSNSDFQAIDDAVIAVSFTQLIRNNSSYKCIELITDDIDIVVPWRL